MAALSCVLTISSRPLAAAVSWDGQAADTSAQSTASELLSSVTTVPGVGLPGDGSPQELTFNSAPGSSDLEISACVGLVLMFDPFASAGLMIRDSPGPDARTATLLYTPARALAFETRSSGGERAVHYTAAAIPAPCLKLVRRGEVVTAYQLGADGAWRWLGEERLAFSGAVSVGVAFSGAWSVSRLFSNVTLIDRGVPVPVPEPVLPDPVLPEPILPVPVLPIPEPPPAIPPPITPPPTPVPETPPAPVPAPDPVPAPPPLPAPTPVPSEYLSGTGSTSWSSANIGDVRVSGLEDTSTALLSLSGAGARIGGDLDAFHYVYQAVAGDVDFVARIVGLQFPAEGAELGLMIRQSLEPRAPHATVGITGTGEVQFRRRLIDAGPTVTATATDIRNPAWLRVRRQGDLFDAFWSSDRAVWNRVSAEALLMAPVIYIGVALASGSPDVLATAQVSDVDVRWRAGINQFPQVRIDWTSGMTWLPGTVLTIPVTASDTDGTIRRVDFYANGALLGSDFEAPYALTWAPGAGIYYVVAVAEDNAGQGTTSAQIQVAIRAGTPVAPQGVTSVPSLSAGPLFTVFSASPDHQNVVAHYVVKLHRATDLETDVPVGLLYIGKPTPADGMIRVNITEAATALPPGSYYAVVNAVGHGGTSPGARSELFNR